MTRFLILILCFLIASCTDREQMESTRDVRELLKEVPGRAGNLHHCYEEPEIITDTPAPRGYKPFYVSHYGRHGSRYLNGMDSYDNALEVLLPMQEKGLLTPSGDSLLYAVQALRDIHDGMSGYLTEKGGRELYGIGSRLAERYPSIFTNKDRQQVLCASSPVQRCIQSMGYFSLGIQSVHKDLDFTLLSGERLRKYIYRRNNMKPYFLIGNEIAMQVLEQTYDPTGTMERLFTDPTALQAHLGEQSAKEFLYEIFAAGDNIDCLEEGTPSVLDFFSEDDIYTFWRVNNIKCYNATGSSIQNERYRPRWMGSALLRDFVEKADLAIEGNGKCADFRFGHDAVLGPFMSFLKLDGFDMHIDMRDSPEHWRGFERLCMGSSIQMVFYRNRSDEVLVKILHNECETSIPSVETFKGPYYRWDVLRDYFMTLLEEEAIWEAELKEAPDYVDIENLY